MMMFMGRPNISRFRNLPKMLATTAMARMANRSSASSPSSVTCVRKFRYTGVTSRAINFLLLYVTPPTPRVIKNSPSRSRPESNKHNPAAVKCRTHELVR